MTTDLRLEIECQFVCPRCKGNPYTLWRRQNVAMDGKPLETYQHHLWPGKDAKAAPPADVKNLVCPRCGVPLERSYGV